MNSQREDLCRAVLAARDEVYRLQIAALVTLIHANRIRPILR
jgi:hypothetical protein